jgi:methyl-accepting chemotaxis protein
MKISTKLILLTAGIGILTMAASSLLSIDRVKRQTAQMSNEIAHASAGLVASQVKARVEVALDEARALGQIFQSVANLEGVELSREEANLLLRDFIERRPEFLGVYVAFEPNAYDGKDAEAAGTPGHDATGRFIPYWTRDTAGQGHLDALLDYEKEGIGDYYLLPKKTLKECVLDPYVYPIQGKEVMLTSLVVPILDSQKRFIGIAGIAWSSRRCSNWCGSALASSREATRSSFPRTAQS